MDAQRPPHTHTQTDTAITSETHAAIARRSAHNTTHSCVQREAPYVAKALTDCAARLCDAQRGEKKKQKNLLPSRMPLHQADDSTHL